MKKAVIYGCGQIGVKVYGLCRDDVDVVAFSDSNDLKWNTRLSLPGGTSKPIIPPYEIMNKGCDVLYLGSMSIDEDFIHELNEEYGIPLSIISDKYISKNALGYSKAARECFLKYESTLLRNVPGSVAEGGVYLGGFASKINECFPERSLYLFDTFSGFDERDISMEREHSYSRQDYTMGFFRKKNFTIEKMLQKMPHPEYIYIYKGYFPEVTYGDERLKEEKFAFVNLDFDLYKPTFAGLEYFFPKMSQGGVILIHDYFSDTFLGAKQAVIDFASQNHVHYFAVGDGISVAMIK